jgi:molybdenum-dependent DNA-binding transcriptional regulator ModE
MDSKSAWMIIVALVVVVATVLIATQWGGVSNGGSSSTTVDPAVRMANPRFMHSPFKVESAQDWH